LAVFLDRDGVIVVPEFRDQRSFTIVIRRIPGTADISRRPNQRAV
jgi:hypothetical protein